MTNTMTKRNGTTLDDLANEWIENIFTPLRANTYTDYSYVERDDNSITLYINAAGLGKEDITIKTKDGQLFISSSLEEEDLTPLVRNIGHRFRIPKEFNAESATAHFKNGILTISLMKDKEKTKETVINIK